MIWDLKQEIQNGTTNDEIIRLAWLEKISKMLRYLQFQVVVFSSSRCEGRKKGEKRSHSENECGILEVFPRRMAVPRSTSTWQTLF